MKLANTRVRFLLLLEFRYVALTLFSGLKPCWCYIKSFSGSFYVRFAIVERSAMGLKLLISTMVFPGLFKGITLPTFKIIGIFALFTEKFMCEWDISVLWGPSGVNGWALFYLGSAPYFSFLSLIALFTVLHLNNLLCFQFFLLLL